MKINLNRIFEVSEAIATEAGKQLADFIQFSSDGFEQVFRAMRNALTFSDNFDCTVGEYPLRHETNEALNIAKTPVGIIPIRVYSETYGVEGFTWFMDKNNQLIVNVKYTGTPTGPLTVRLVILHA